MGKKGGKIALGLGLLTGALTGLLFAPEEGKKMRKKLAKGDKNALVDGVIKMGEEIGSFAKNRFDDLSNVKQEDLDKIMKDAHQKAETFKKKVSDYVKAQKAELEKMNAKAKPKTTAKAKPKAKTVSKAKSVAKPKTAVAKKPAPKKKVAPKKKA